MWKRARRIRMISVERIPVSDATFGEHAMDRRSPMKKEWPDIRQERNQPFCIGGMCHDQLFYCVVGKPHLHRDLDRGQQFAKGTCRPVVLRCLPRRLSLTIRKSSNAIWVNAGLPAQSPKRGEPWSPTGRSRAHSPRASARCPHVRGRSRWYSASYPRQPANANPRRSSPYRRSWCGVRRCRLSARKRGRHGSRS